MKKFIFLFLLTLSMNVSAQRIDKPNEPYYIYCLVNIQYDAYMAIGGDENLYFILDENGEKIKIYGLATITTYMSKRGWEFVERTTGVDTFFRKKVVSDSEAYSYLKLMYKTGKDKGKIREEIKE